MNQYHASDVPRPPIRRDGAPPVPSAPPDQLPLNEVLVELWQNTEKLFHQELALARTELTIKGQKLRAEAKAAAIGGGLMAGGGLALLASVILLLATVMPAWVAALLTSAALSLVGFALLKKNQPSLADAKPERTIQSLKKDLKTISEVSR